MNSIIASQELTPYIPISRPLKSHVISEQRLRLLKRLGLFPVTFVAPAIQTMAHKSDTGTLPKKPDAVDQRGPGNNNSPELVRRNRSTEDIKRNANMLRSFGSPMIIVKLPASHRGHYL